MTSRSAMNPVAVSQLSALAKSSQSLSQEKSTDGNGKRFKKGPYDPGAIFEGKINYTIVAILRYPGKHAEYCVREAGADESKNKDYVMKLEPANRFKLQFLSSILSKSTKAKELCAHDRYYLLEFFEFGVNTKLETNYIITCGYGFQLSEVYKILKKKFTHACVINIGLQTLECIRALHTVGFVNRNIKPATFSLGTKDEEILMSDYRLTRLHFDEKGQPRTKREKTAFVGTVRYASVDTIKEIEPGRKDDIESWLYMLYDLFDGECGITWKNMTRDRGLKEKESFRKHQTPSMYRVVPTEFKAIVDHLNTLEYASVPNYSLIKEVLLDTAKSKNYDVTTADWTKRNTMDTMNTAINDLANKTADLICEGKDDFEKPENARKKKHKKQKPRKLMNPGDTIQNGGTVWKVVVLLGSGGFGDVYKVYNNNTGKQPQYAMKTETEDGAKVMLRLKVEMQVMMAIQEYRKAPKKPEIGKPFKHFVDFVDRGKSEDLKCKFIVMSLVGPSLDDCRKKYRVDLSDKCTPWIIGVQSLEALRDMHTLGYLHRDIKPANYAVGVGADEHIVYLLDFGICRSFLDPVTKQHRAPRKLVKFLGTLRYASRACMKTVDQGRKDDLECWLYMIYDILDDYKGITWKTIQHREKILEKKVKFFKEKHNSNVTSKIRAIVEYIDKMEYQSEPDYDFILARLARCAEHLKCPITNMNPKKVSWVGKLKVVPKVERFSDESDSEQKSGESEED